MSKVHIIRVQSIRKFNIENEQEYAFLDESVANAVYMKLRNEFKDSLGKNPGNLIFKDSIELYNDASQFSVNKNARPNVFKTLSNGYQFTGGRKRPFR